MESKGSYKQSASKIWRLSSILDESFTIFEIINIKTIDIINQASNASHKSKEKGFKRGETLCCSYFSS